MAEAQQFVRALVGALEAAIPARWSKVLVLMLLGLLFNALCLSTGLAYLWQPDLLPLWAMLTIGAAILAGVSYMAAIVNACMVDDK